MSGITIQGQFSEDVSTILSTEALAFVASLQREFGEERRRLLADREKRQAAIDAGEQPGFLASTQDIHERDWSVAPTPPDLVNRMIEITGPVDRKMVINALNSGANAFMADFEDSLSPTWDNIVDGQRNLYDAIRRTITFSNPDGREYQLNDETATLLVRPRGWHLEEAHAVLGEEPVSASLFDFGLYFFHNARELLERGSGPYFYLPKLQNAREAQLWNDVFVYAQEELGIDQGAIRATVLIEHILAAFEMDEILYELRDHAAGLNAGRWDYIFSVIKVYRQDSSALLPDRSQVTMAVPFMRAYTELLVQTCHRRGAHAMGGMAAFIPTRHDPDANALALSNVEQDKDREALAGFDGTWVAHPGLIETASSAFRRVLEDQPNQKERLREDVSIEAADLTRFAISDGAITEEGIRLNISVAIQYIQAWLDGIGAAAINNLMEDAATAEISRAQLWQWIRHDATTTDGQQVTTGLFQRLRDEELAKLEESRGQYRAAAELLDQIVLSESFVEFLTGPAYRELISESIVARA